MIYVLICLVAFIGSGLTLFSGFGLGTILLPCFALFFPVELAIALTAIVHFLNNLFKLALFGKFADKKITLAFGIPSVIAAIAGAYLLTAVSEAEPLYSYKIGEHSFFVLPVKLMIAFI